MALTGPDHWQPEQGGVMVTATGMECFFCEKTIEADPAWMWHGAGGEVFMHPACAADLGIRLFADLLRWQRTSGTRFGQSE